MTQLNTAPAQLLRLPEVRNATGLSRSTLYRLAARGAFPAPVKLSERASAWNAAEVREWIAARIGERDTRKAA